MLELLPNAHKKALKKEYFLRLTAVSLSFLIAVELFFLVSLLPSYFLSVVKESVVNKEFENAMKSNNNSEDKELQADIKETKEMVALLKSKGDNLLMKDLILKIIDRKSSGIKINGISVSYSKNGQYQIIVKGMSKDRELLKLFAERLRSEKAFSSVDLPISNFTKISDIDFNITLKTTI
ncbi:MAG: hypothetical protein HW401_182 [Parcubacteria group bacterium]|nr:hypothetical protein [Parcubacteria group bacterium]